MSQEGHPANLLERHKKVNVLDSEDISETLCKLLKLQAAPEVDMEPFDGNVLNYHHLMALFKEIVESKVEDSTGRLIRLLKYTSGEAKELINHCIQLLSNEGFKYAKYLLGKVYGNLHKILATYRKEIKQWPQIKFGDARAFLKFHTFLLKCRNMSFNQRWNALDSPDILCMLISKLPRGIMERWNRKVLNIRRCQEREPTLNDMTDFIEEETILMNDPLFSHEALAHYHTKLEHPVRQKWMKNYTIKAEDENKKDVRGSSEDNSSKCKMCNGRHDLDECKAFNDMTVEERSKFLSKQKLCYGYYEVTSSKHSARNCPRRRN